MLRRIFLFKTLPAGRRGRFCQTAFALVRRELALSVEKPAACAAPEMVCLRACKPAGYRVLRIVPESTVRRLSAGS